MLVNSPVLGREVVFGVLLNVTLIAFGIFRYPATLREGGVLNIVLPIVLLLLYGLAGWFAWRRTDEVCRIALRQGAIVGVVLGIVMMIHLTAEYFVDMSQKWNAITSLGLFPILFFSFGLAGLRGSLCTGQVRLGVVAGVWSAIICILIVCNFGFIVNYTFMPRLEYILHDEYVRSGVRDLKAFTVLNSLESAGSHLLIAPILALIFGCIGGLIGKGLASHRTRLSA